MSEDRFLSRWSRMKRASAAGPAGTTADAVPVKTGNQSPENAEPPKPPVPLPPLESLTPESDFTPFMGAEVDPGLRRDALKKLFADPQFNIMDGLDVYIDDYSKPDPLPEGWLEKMNQVARLGAFVEKQLEEPEKAPAGAPEALAASNTSGDGLTSAEVGELHLREVEKPESSGVDCTKYRHDDA